MKIHDMFGRELPIVHSEAEKERLGYLCRVRSKQKWAKRRQRLRLRAVLFGSRKAVVAQATEDPAVPHSTTRQLTGETP